MGTRILRMRQIFADSLRRAWCFHQALGGVGEFDLIFHKIALGENTKRGGKLVLFYSLSHLVVFYDWW